MYKTDCSGRSSQLKDLFHIKGPMQILFMWTSLFAALEKEKKKLLRIAIQIEFPWEKPKDSSQHVAIINCTFKVSVLLYHIKMLPAGLKHVFLKYWDGRWFLDVTAAEQCFASSVYYINGCSWRNAHYRLPAEHSDAGVCVEWDASRLSFPLKSVAKYLCEYGVYG